jgi:transcription initiation factor IIE alpha subunit
MVAAQPNLSFFNALRAIISDELAVKVFRSLLDESLSSGWSLVKSLSAKPEDIRRVLGDLSETGVVGQKGDDLAGFYYLTAFGSKFKDQIPVPEKK